jgi:hypothetical protein
MKNRHSKGAHVSEARFREVIRFFAADLPSLTAAELTGLNYRTVHRIDSLMRERLVEMTFQEMQPFAGDIEVDESRGPQQHTGFKILMIDSRTLDHGTAPLMLEPVKAVITCGRPVAAVNILDQDGLRTGKTLPVANNTFAIDSAKEKTIYYEVVFKKPLLGLPGRDAGIVLPLAACKVYENHPALFQSI